MRNLTLAAAAFGLAAMIAGPVAAQTQNSTNENASSKKPAAPSGASEGASGKASPTQNATNENATSKGTNAGMKGHRASKGSRHKHAKPTQNQ